jgi:hypothetical protein
VDPGLPIDAPSALEEASKEADAILLLLMNEGPMSALRARDAWQDVDGITVARHNGYVLSMGARTRSYFRSILTLVRHRAADEALSLGRGLFEDSLRLGVLAGLEEGQRVDALMRWVITGITREIKLMENARKLGVGGGHAEVIKALRMQQGSAIRYRDSTGTGRSGRRDPLSEQNLKEQAMRTERESSWWLHEVGDQSVHGGLFSHRLRRSNLGNGVVGFDLSFDNPGGRLDILAYAAESAAVSHRAICSIISARFDDQIDVRLARIEQLQDHVANLDSV